MTSPSSLDAIETTLAARRISRWPSEWKQFVLGLPAEEQRMIGLCVALMDAKPDDPRPAE